ncbi:MAG TPA: hypothetical protein VKZ18_11125 [Polyangia bacterium]|nr:hypothetical protein [Polyangia bacterium]
MGSLALALSFVLLLGSAGCGGKGSGGTGGESATGGTGQGGSASGGSMGSGGTTGSGGATGGTTGSGGATGGSGAGGATGTGGATGKGGAAGGGGAKASGGATGSGGAAGGGGAKATGGATGGGGAGGSCIGASMLSKLGKNRLLVGVSTSDTTAAMAPFDIRYIYISGGLFDSATPCTACGASCMAGGNVCTTSCIWWGCYNTPPGMYATYFMQAAAKNAQVPMFTYYELLQTAKNTISGFTEGSAEATQAATNTSLMTRYYNDWRFLLQAIGQNKALLHIEPDFWGYARQAGAATAAAAVASANPTDCGSLPNTIGGMGQCLISMVRKYAPNALVGLSASAWNIASNTNKSTDVTTDAKALATFLAACGQSSADFIAVETSDRDAGYYQIVESQNNWWDATDTKLPDYAQDLAWVKALTEALGTPALYWQTPLGNANQNNTADHYQDNRVDYFFGGNAAGVESAAPTTVPAHWTELAAAHVVGAAFGAGEGTQTTPDSDGGYLVSKTKAYVSSGGQALCP